jgi:hypothetical protein
MHFQQKRPPMLRRLSAHDRHASSLAPHACDWAEEEEIELFDVVDLGGGCVAVASSVGLITLDSSTGEKTTVHPLAAAVNKAVRVCGMPNEWNSSS